MLTVENLSLTYDKKVLYHNASFRVLPKEKIGIVGSNGVGKTTLVQILGNKVLPDSGKISFNRLNKVGFLDQQLKIDQKITIKSYLEQAFVELFDKYKQMNDTLTKINQTTDPIILERLVRVFTNLRDQLEAEGFYLIDSKIMKIANGLGITNFGIETQLERLSGGQKVRVIFAKLLLENPDLIILDEPTNFLDAVHVDWLIKYLKEYKGTFLIVSHHQEFLNEVVNNILEIEHTKITKYSGNYQQYLQKKTMKEKEYERRFLSQQKKISKLEDYIQKNKVRASTSNQAKSREKKLARMEILEKPNGDYKRMQINFNYQPISSYKLLECKKLEIGYYYSLLPSFSFEIKSGDKIAITGFNGIGKTTLLKTLIGQLKPISGFYKFVDNAKIAYFAQEHEWDDLKMTPFQIVANRWPLMDKKEIRSALARAGISSSQAMQPLQTLSGGEQTKLKLCLIMLMPSNVLILDEPTNHLDSNSKKALKEALKEYPGTILFVSHERDFIKNLATREFSIEQLLIS